MTSAMPCVLTINGGSSSIRFAVYEAGEALRPRLSGKIDRIGGSGTNLIVKGPDGAAQVRRRLLVADHRKGQRPLICAVGKSVRLPGSRIAPNLGHRPLALENLFSEIPNLTFNFSVNGTCHLLQENAE